MILSRDRYNGILSPRQSGSTFTLCWIAILDALTEKRRVVIWTNTNDLARANMTQAERLIRDFELSGTVKRIVRSYGQCEINFTSGGSIRFRSYRSSRLEVGDTVMIDEADFIKSEAFWAIHAEGVSKSDDARVFVSAIRSTAFPDLSNYMWSVATKVVRNSLDRKLSLEELDDESLWHLANPGIPEFVRLDAIRLERETMTDEMFASERLGGWL